MRVSISSLWLESNTNELVKSNNLSYRLVLYSLCPVIQVFNAYLLITFVINCTNSNHSFTDTNFFLRRISSINLSINFDDSFAPKVDIISLTENSKVLVKNLQLPDFSKYWRITNLARTIYWQIDIDFSLFCSDSAIWSVYLYLYSYIFS